MKQIVLLFLFSFSLLSLRAAIEPFGGDHPDFIGPTVSIFDYENNISIFPNPTTEFISVTNDSKIKEITIFNLVGRKMLTFQAVSGNKYNVSELPNGMYLVQLRDQNLKVITTQRISKR